MIRHVTLLLLCMVVVAASFGQDVSRRSPEELLISVEKNPVLFQAAKRLAIERGQPVSISLPEAFMYPVVVQDGNL